MKYDEYIEEIEKKFVRFFNIQKNFNENGVNIDMYADYTSIMGRTFLTLADVIDRYDVCEKCYFKHYLDPNKNDMDHYFKFLIDRANSIVPSEFHRSTDITGIMVCDNLDLQNNKYIKRFKYVKYFNIYLRGWVEARLICVDLSTLKVYASPSANKIKKIYKIDNKYFLHN